MTQAACSEKIHFPGMQILVSRIGGEHCGPRGGWANPVLETYRVGRRQMRGGLGQHLAQVL